MTSMNCAFVMDVLSFCLEIYDALRDKLEVDRYQSLVLYFLMSIFRCKTFFKDNEMAIKIDNYNIHKQYQKEEKLVSTMF